MRIAEEKDKKSSKKSYKKSNKNSLPEIRDKRLENRDKSIDIYTVSKDTVSQTDVQQSDIEQVITAWNNLGLSDKQDNSSF